MFNKTLIQQFLFICETKPKAIALQNDSEQLSYARLKYRISKVSAIFLDQGVQAGDRVALVVNNSIEYVVAFYAAWKIGAIVVALNPQTKPHEIKSMLRQCNAKLLVIDKLTLVIHKQLAPLNVPIIVVIESQVNDIIKWPDALSLSGNDDWYPAKESTMAQIIFTSGTTGNPKGVSLSHGNLMSNVKDVVSYLKLSDEDSILNILPFHYCYGNSILHTHFCVGGKVILAGSMAYPQETVDRIRKLNVSGFSGVPSTFSLLLSRTDWSENPPKLRYLTQAGGPMGNQLTEKLILTSHNKTQLYVMYGQTEATARISWLPPSSLTSKRGSVGIPLPQVQLEIRDKQNNLVNNFQIGEVYIKGPSIMQGYWKNPRASKKVLIDGWLKTGDLGYLDDEGYLFLQGRNSDMLKVGAHRINPLELEEIINKLNFVKESVVIGIVDEILGHKLCAYIVGDESKVNLFAIKKHCNQYLPPHKIPREIIWLNYLPKTASGKIKRHQLNQKMEISQNDKQRL